MTPSAAVLVCALDLLGRSHAIAPIVLIAAPPPHASPTAEAFITRDPDIIYLVTSTRIFVDALSDRWSAIHREACKKLASIIVHEEWHLRHGPDERGAYLAQLTTLQWLGAASVTLTGVRQAMAAVANGTNQKSGRGNRVAMNVVSGGESSVIPRRRMSGAAGRDR
jgi:hypothetical protein